MCHKQNIQSIARSIFFVDAHVPQQLFNISICRFDAYDYLCTQRIQCYHVHIFFAPIDSSKIFLESSGLYNQNYTHIITRIRMYYRERNFSSSYIYSLHEIEYRICEAFAFSQKRFFTFNQFDANFTYAFTVVLGDTDDANRIYRTAILLYYSEGWVT